MTDAIRYQTAKFVASYGSASKIPPSTCPEVCFVGRSNVGKSSIMNKLFNRKNLVKVSSTPGKTSNVNFFVADGVHFVDLPGYGFAQRSKSERERWADLIFDFLDMERSFNLVVSLVDIRHDPSKLDHQMIEFLQEGGYPFVVALTKADKLSRSQQGRHILDSAGCQLYRRFTGLQSFFYHQVGNFTACVHADSPPFMARIKSSRVLSCPYSLHVCIWW